MKYIIKSKHTVSTLFVQLNNVFHNVLTWFDKAERSYTRGDEKIIIGDGWMRLLTPHEYQVDTEDWLGMGEFTQGVNVDNARAGQHWLEYGIGLFGLGDVGLRIDSNNRTIAIIATPNVEVAKYV